MVPAVVAHLRWQMAICPRCSLRASLMELKAAGSHCSMLYIRLGLHGGSCSWSLFVWPPSTGGTHTFTNEKKKNEAKIVFHRSSCAHRRCFCSNEPNGEILHPEQVLLFWDCSWHRGGAVRGNLNSVTLLCLCCCLLKHISCLLVRFCTFLPHCAQNWLKNQSWVVILLN